MAFLAAKRSHENHGQKTRFKDAFTLRSMDSLTLTVGAINRPHDSLYTVNSRVHSEECAGSRTRRLLAQSPIVSLFGMAIDVSPGQKTPNPPLSQPNTQTALT